MTDINKIYDDHLEKLVKCLPMDDIHFITRLSVHQLLPGDTADKIKSMSTQAEKASYFLSHVIKPALEIDDISDFNKLLSVMQKCGYNHVKNFSCKLRHEINKLSSLRSGTPYICTYVT